MSEKHVLLTGPVMGPIKLPDGTVVDVTPELLEFDTLEQAAEVAHQIGLLHAATGHPHDVEFDEKTGKRVQRKFVYDDAHHKKHGKKGGK